MLVVAAANNERRRKVLVVDDDAPLLRMLGLLLRGCGFDVTTTSNATDALFEAIHERPEVIVLDLAMPRIDGWTLYRQLRENSIDARVLILSAYDARTAQRKLGADASLAKPFEVDELVERIQQLT
jgi:DNA-binding response OmpR family regulator